MTQIDAMFTAALVVFVLLTAAYYTGRLQEHLTVRNKRGLKPKPKVIGPPPDPKPVSLFDDPASEIENIHKYCTRDNCDYVRASFDPEAMAQITLHNDRILQGENNGNSADKETS